MPDTVGKIEQLTEHDIFNPKLMTPRSSELWKRYKNLSKYVFDNRFREVDARYVSAELEDMKVDIEYQCGL